jgi:hypothetical protein
MNGHCARVRNLREFAKTARARPLRSKPFTHRHLRGPFHGFTCFYSLSTMVGRGLAIGRGDEQYRNIVHLIIRDIRHFFANTIQL